MPKHMVFEFMGYCLVALYASLNELKGYSCIEYGRVPRKWCSIWEIIFKLASQEQQGGAGDWGQIAHCKKYNKIFVISDRFAAIYANFCGVRYMFLRRKEYTEFVSYTLILRNK